jgi:hypothetical protein
MVIVIAVLAITAGISVAYSFSPPSSLQSRQYDVALGSATALVDSPSSQVVDLGGSETVRADIGSLSARATLLASVMTSSPLKDEIAARAGVPPQRLIAISPATASPIDGAASAQPKIAGRGIYVLKATVPALSSGQVPLIAIETQAPESEQAARLADAAISVLQKHLESTAATDNVPSERRLIVSQLGPGRAEVETRGPGKEMAAVATLAVFGLGCGAILALVALIGGWREASEWERMPVSDEEPFPHAAAPVNLHEANGHEPRVPRTPPVPRKLTGTRRVAEAPRFDAPASPAEPRTEAAPPPRNWASR